MPNLRKKSSVLTYNDDAIYRAIENQRRISNGVSKMSRRPKAIEKDVPILETDRKIPEFVYADDGRKFFPCLFCCHAFAYKQHQLAHMQQCNFRVIKTVTKRPSSQITAGKMQSLSRPKSLGTQSKKDSNQPRKVINKPQQSHPKVIVQKTKHLNSVGGNTAVKIVKQLPKKINFPKIKLEPTIENQNKLTNFQPQHGNQNIKIVKHANLQPGPENQNKKFIKLARSGTQKVVKSCPQCNNVFDSFASLLRHKREKHMYPKIYVSAEKLKEYDEMYKKSDMSKCTLCSKPVPKIRWSRHLQTHINERNYPCNVCTRTFSRKDHRDVHAKKHVSDMISPFITP